MDSTIIAALIGASASIVATLIAIRGHRPGGDRTRNDPPAPPKKVDHPGRPPKPNPPVDQRPRFTVHGEVIRTIGKDLGIRVENERNLRVFWRDHRIDTDLNWFDDGPPVVSIGRQADVARCKPGDRASLTFVVVDRAGDKRGTRTVDFESHPNGTS